jgi:hypothetical protein
LSSSSEVLPILFSSHIWTMTTWLFLVNLVLKLDVMIYIL